jgi:hypothetical protein
MALSTTRELITPSAKQVRHADTCDRLIGGISNATGLSLRGGSMWSRQLVRRSDSEERLLTPLSTVAGPLFIGIDTHSLAEPELCSAIEVFSANGINIMVDETRRLHANAGHLTGTARSGWTALRQMRWQV